VSDESILRCLLPLRTVRALEKGGITNVEQLKASYPEGLIRLQGFGMGSLRAVEAVFFKDLKYVRQRKKLPKGKRIPSLSEDLAAFLRTQQGTDYRSLK